MLYIAKTEINAIYSNEMDKYANEECLVGDTVTNEITPMRFHDVIKRNILGIGKFYDVYFFLECDKILLDFVQILGDIKEYNKKVEQSFLIFDRDIDLSEKGHSNLKCFSLNCNYNECGALMQTCTKQQDTLSIIFASLHAFNMDKFNVFFLKERGMNKISASSYDYISILEILNIIYNSCYKNFDNYKYVEFIFGTNIDRARTMVSVTLNDKVKLFLSKYRLLGV